MSVTIVCDVHLSFDLPSLVYPSPDMCRCKRTRQRQKLAVTIHLQFFFQFGQPSSPMEYIFHFPLKFHRFEVQFRQFHCAVTHSSHRTRIISLLFFLRKIYNLSFIQHIYRERGSAITRVKSSTLANFFRAIDCGTR